MALKINQARATAQLNVHKEKYFNAHINLRRYILYSQESLKKVH